MVLMPTESPEYLISTESGVTIKVGGELSKGMSLHFKPLGGDIQGVQTAH
jgi:hypothetical protein